MSLLHVFAAPDTMEMNYGDELHENQMTFILICSLEWEKSSKCECWCCPV